MYLFVPQNVANTFCGVSIQGLIYNTEIETITYFVLLHRNYNHLANYYTFVNQ